MGFTGRGLCSSCPQPGQTSLCCVPIPPCLHNPSQPRRFSDDLFPRLRPFSSFDSCHLSEARPDFSLRNPERVYTQFPAYQATRHRCDREPDAQVSEYMQRCHPHSHRQYLQVLRMEGRLRRQIELLSLLLAPITPAALLSHKVQYFKLLKLDEC